MTQVNVDEEFKCILEEIQPIILNIVAAGEHTCDIERANRSIKEGTRYEYRCPYQWYPYEMVKGCCIKVTKDHIDLPANDGFSDMYGSGIVVTGSQRLDYNRLKV